MASSRRPQVSDSLPFWPDLWHWPDISGARSILGLSAESFLDHLAAGRMTAYLHEGEIRFHRTQLYDFADEIREQVEAEVEERVWAASTGRQIGWIYFIERSEPREIKIGYASDPRKRRKGLQTASAGKLAIVGVLRGTKTTEGAIKQGFVAAKKEGEWFRDEPRLRKFMREFAGPVEALDQAEDLSLFSDETEVFLRDTLERIGHWFAANPSPAPPEP